MHQKTITYQDLWEGTIDGKQVYFTTEQPITIFCNNPVDPYYYFYMIIDGKMAHGYCKAEAATIIGYAGKMSITYSYIGIGGKDFLRRKLTHYDLQWIEIEYELDGYFDIYTETEHKYHPYPYSK